MLGIILGLTSALGFGASPLFARLGMQYMRPTTGTLISLAVGTTIAMTAAFALHAGEIFALSGAAFLWFLFAGVVTFAMARVLNYTGVRFAGVSRATPIMGTSPLFAAILAVSVGGETANAPILAGTALIVAGVVMILTQR